jgi:amino acid transporter
MGILVAWLFYLALSAAPAANVNLFLIYLAEFWPPVKEPWPRFLIITMLIGLLTLINVLGVRHGTTTNNVFTIAKVLSLLIVILAGVAMILLRPAAAQVPLYTS